MNEREPTLDEDLAALLRKIDGEFASMTSSSVYQMPSESKQQRYRAAIAEALAGLDRRIAIHNAVNGE